MAAGSSLGPPVAHQGGTTNHRWVSTGATRDLKMWLVCYSTRRLDEGHQGRQWLSFLVYVNWSSEQGAHLQLGVDYIQQPLVDGARLGLALILRLRLGSKANTGRFLRLNCTVASHIQASSVSMTP